MPLHELSLRLEMFCNVRKVCQSYQAESIVQHSACHKVLQFITPVTMLYQFVFQSAAQIYDPAPLEGL